jgi:hypothetical protein
MISYLCFELIENYSKLVKCVNLCRATLRFFTNSRSIDYPLFKKRIKNWVLKSRKKRARESLESNCKWLSGNTRVRQSGT